MAINSINSTMRITGLGGSGLDTDTIVKQLMDAERIPLNRLYQKKQLAEWKQEAYRDITNKLRELKDSYFNAAKPASNLLSTSSFKKYTGTSTNSSYVTISGNSDAVAGSHTVSVISLATAGQAVSGSGITKALTGSEISDFDLSGKTINITLDGVTKTITLGDYSENPDQIGSKLQELVNDAFGSNKIIVSYTDQKLTFNTTGGASRITMGDGTNDGLSALGFTPGASNRLNINRSLESLSGTFQNELTFTDDKLVFYINGSKFSFDKSTSLTSMMNTINMDADAKVNIKYDETTDRFIMTSKQMGAGENIVITTLGGNFFGDNGASGIRNGNATTVQGSDAKARIDGTEVTRSSNTFTINGATYTLVKAHANPAAESETVTLNPDTEAVYSNIKSFVDKYNELISYINTMLTDKYDRDYQPLTNEQKEEMSEDEIKTWESKAKTGLLRNDSLLQNIVYSMRRALSDSVSDLAVNLSSIGITTGNYSEKGKLVIDESKLKAAIEASPDAVAELFTKKSDIDYSENNTAEQRSERYRTLGLAGRLSDILEDNIRTTGKKGLLLQKAGIEGDATQFNSILYKQIDDYEDDIYALTLKLNDKEDRYYAKFTALEKYISQMSMQSSWIASQFSNTSG